MSSATSLPWPDHLDARIAAAEFHILLLENEQVRVLRTRIAPGQRTPVHTHRWPSVQYVLGWSDFLRRDEAGLITLDSRTMPPPVPGAALWSAPLAPHCVENIGNSDLDVVVVELKPGGTRSIS